MLKAFAEWVDNLLWEEWDPIGVNDIEDALGEYSSYALTIAGKAWNGENEQTLLAYLYWAESENMGLSCTREQADQKNISIVKKIVQTCASYKNKGQL